MVTDYLVVSTSIDANPRSTEEADVVVRSMTIVEDGEVECVYVNPSLIKYPRIVGTHGAEEYIQQNNRHGSIVHR